MANERGLLPHSVDAEEAVIGSLLIDPVAINKIVDSLNYRDFYSKKGQFIFQSCLALYQRSEAINQITVARELDSRGKLTDIGGAAYLSYLIANCPTSLDIEDYSEIVYKLAMHRKFIQICLEDAETGYDTKVKIEDIIDRHLSSMDTIKPARSKYLELTNLRIIKSNPPHYILNVNGADLSLSIGELQVWGKFRIKVLSELDFIPLKPKNWEGLINKLLDQSQKMEAPADTSADIEVKLSVKRWFEQMGEGTEYSDLQSGSYAVVSYRGKETNFEKKEYWAFQPTPLKRWLKRNIEKTISLDSLWSMMVGWGAVKHQWRVGKTQGSLPVKLWALPPDFAAGAEFTTEEEEKQPELLPEETIEEELPDF